MATTTNHGKNLCLSCFWWSKGKCRLHEYLQQEQPEVDLEKAARYVYESWMGGTMDDVRRDMVELGNVLDARREEGK